ncbi:hypothetical protein [Natronorubrum halalkaliphilum]|nr:hypothetical protein [Natronorubrum halalkaliphilum]
MNRDGPVGIVLANQRTERDERNTGAVSGPLRAENVLLPIRRWDE